VRVGVDVGGTFTDLVGRDAKGQCIRELKVPTTPANQSVGVLAGVAALGLALYLFWRWAIAASLGLARALATRRNARRRPAA